MIYTEQQKLRPAYIFLLYLKLKYQKIFYWLYINTTMCNHRIVVVILGFAIPLALKITSKVCIPEIESHWVCEDFSQKSLDIICRACKWENWIFLLRLTNGMSVDTTCLKNLVSGIEVRKICHFPNDVFRMEKKVWNQLFLKKSSLKKSKFVYPIIRVI